MCYFSSWVCAGFEPRCSAVATVAVAKAKVHLRFVQAEVSLPPKCGFPKRPVSVIYGFGSFAGLTVGKILARSLFVSRPSF